MADSRLRDWSSSLNGWLSSGACLEELGVGKLPLSPKVPAVCWSVGAGHAAGGFSDREVLGPIAANSASGILGDKSRGLAVLRRAWRGEGGRCGRLRDSNVHVRFAVAAQDPEGWWEELLFLWPFGRPMRSGAL